MSTSASATPASAAPRKSRSNCATRSASWWAPSTSCIDDLTTAARKPVQIEFTGPDSRKLLEITNAYMDKLRQVPGAVDVGLSEQDPKNELQIELNRGLANSMGISVSDAAQSLRVAFAGVEVGDWVDPTGETRDVAVRLHPDDRVSAENIERLPIAVTGTNQMVPLDQIATITMGKGPSGHLAQGWQAHHCRVAPTPRAVRLAK